MNITQMHERLRIEMLRRIQRGTLSISLLARLTGLGVSHVSNFLHSRRKLSLNGMDRVLAAQHMFAEDLLERSRRGNPKPENAGISSIPVVSHASALLEPTIPPSAIQMMLHLSPAVIRASKSKPAPTRNLWERFVAIRVTSEDVRAMDPLLQPDALVVIDRHYNTLVSYRGGRPNLCAVRNGARLSLRFADYVAMHLVLRPVSLAFPVSLIEIGPDTSVGDLIAGRVVLILNEV